ncbi:hypothetical protein GTA08_BOTSDO07523 [Botryosphaeria dothidea]|uniref:Uncharacterized protein n=1 Tax=Botryosphaeria dothidea TaxID=55169 RepID=A0A8H4IM34_9PEZI|nr:hypothetical protein GTA08_BOTSDO07523 [Botryosphaeria dothidea]
MRDVRRAAHDLAAERPAVLELRMQGTWLAGSPTIAPVMRRACRILRVRRPDEGSAVYGRQERERSEMWVAASQRGRADRYRKHRWNGSRVARARQTAATRANNHSPSAPAQPHDARRAECARQVRPAASLSPLTAGLAVHRQLVPTPAPAPARTRSTASGYQQVEGIAARGLLRQRCTGAMPSLPGRRGGRGEVALAVGPPRAQEDSSR